MRKHDESRFKRRRRDRRSRQLDVAKMEQIGSANDVEEQLKRQRLKKMTLRLAQENSLVASDAQTEGCSNSPSSMKKKALGNSTYDPVRGTYFPTEFLEVAERQIHQNHSPNDFPNVIDACFRAPFVAQTVQLLHGSARRRRFIGQWGSQMMLNSLTRQQLQDFHIEQLRLPLRVLPSEKIENTCISPWSRCFGVVSAQNCIRPPKFFTLYNNPYNHGKALLRNGGIGCLEKLERRTLYSMYDKNGNVTFVDLFHDEMNDFTQLRHHPDVIIFAGNRGRIFSIHAETSLEFASNSSTRDKTAKSDILCVESDCSGSRPDLVFCGQRNGQILIHDIRTSVHTKHLAGTLLNRKQNDPLMDSVFSVKTIFDHRPDQVLVRGRNSWGMNDLRGLGGCENSDKSLIQKVPFECRNDYLSIPGKGMAVDPLQSTMIVPFWHETNANDKSHEVSLKFWSLESGDYIGAKVFQNDTLGTRNVADPKRQYTFANKDLELCPTLTHAWSFRPTSAETGEFKEAKRLPGAFGLWLKVGIDNIHHIACDGRLDSHRASRTINDTS